MIESATLLTLCMLYLIFFRPGKTPPLENPLVIERPGQYHLTLAPKLNLAQPFVEAVINQLRSSGEPVQNSKTCYFEVRDKQVAAHGFDFYLLAITERDGMVLVQASRPLSKDAAGQLQNISEFAHPVLAKFPEDDVQVSGEKIAEVVQKVARLRQVQVKMLTT